MNPLPFLERTVKLRVTVSTVPTHEAGGWLERVKQIGKCAQDTGGHPKSVFRQSESS